MREDDTRVYFFDTSALVKRYHKELGTDVVDAVFRDKDATRMISDIGVVEFYSAFAKKVRTREITEEDFQETVNALAQDIQSGPIQLAFFAESEKKEAALLIMKYSLSRNLRTLDAMQLAVMKKIGARVITHVYCADQPFAGLVEEEGFSVINPEQPPEAEDENGE